MGKRLVIAEKPMLAKAILDAIPGTAKSIKAGERVFYTEKGDYLVVALTGAWAKNKRGAGKKGEETNAPSQSPL